MLRSKDKEKLMLNLNDYIQSNIIWMIYEQARKLLNTNIPIRRVMTLQDKIKV